MSPSHRVPDEGVFLTIELAQFRNELQAAPVFAELAFAALDELPDERDVQLRTGAVKNLMEEILPFALLARYLDVPERRVRCRYLGKSEDEADGELFLHGRAVELGFWPHKILVEVTCAEDSKAYLRREALARYGGVFTGQDIKRTSPRHKPNSAIVSRPVVREGNAGITEMASLVQTAIAKKMQKSYTPKRLLLVRLDPDFALTHSKLCLVATQSHVTNALNVFLGIFLVDCSTGYLLQTS